MATPEIVKKMLDEQGVVYGIIITNELLDVWFELLSRFEDEKVKDAFRKHLKKEKFFPKPCEILSILSPSLESTIVC